ncbi:MAG: dihydrolipoyl dehydrogenase [Muribaculaceae bacterium]|nr:dihydrolipoyl dehydrogenase [Muribaculaceae bacterium]
MNQADLIIIGAGPGGYETAAEAAAEGLNVVIIERAELGGTCLNRGCIPTKALCRSAQVALDVKEASAYGVDVNGFTLNYPAAAARKDEVVAQLRQGVEMALSRCTVVCGEARFVEPRIVAVGEESYTAPKIIIATGSSPARLPIPGADLAVDSDRLLSMTSFPERVTIIGGGVIGMEFASILSAFGVAVTVVEYCKEILPPFDKDISKRLKMALSKRGINIITSAAVTEIKPDLTVVYEAKGKQAEVASDLVVMAVGRRPVLPAGIDCTGITVGRRGIEVDDNMMTSVEGIYAIGDVNGRCMLAHAASAQGRRVLGKPVDLDVVPSAVFTTPECAMVGLTEEQCKERQLPFKSAKALFRANGKALAMNESEGLVKMIVNTETRMILGCHICGPHAADLIQEVALAMARALPVDAIADTIHGHPTLGEAVQQAARML